jgi:hypothetical protein
LLGRLFRHPRIHSEAGPFGRAACIFAVTGRTTANERLLREQLPSRQKKQESKYDHSASRERYHQKVPGRKSFRPHRDSRVGNDRVE